MKRKCVWIVLAVCILLCGCGRGQEPEQPQISTMPVQQLRQETESAAEGGIGRFLYYPYSEEALFAPAGTNEVCFYFEKNDIVPNAGYVKVYDAFTGTVYDAIDVSDENRCRRNGFDAAATQYTGWEEGSSISVYFDRSFLPDGTYFLTVDEGCFMTEDGTVSSRAVGGADQVVFGIAPYGLNSIDTTLLENFRVGDVYHLGVLLDGDAVCAVITDYNGRTVSLDRTRLTETDYFTLEFLQTGESSVTVSFYDAADTLLNTVTFHYTVM